MWKAMRCYRFLGPNGPSGSVSTPARQALNAYKGMGDYGLFLFHDSQDPVESRIAEMHGVTSKLRPAWLSKAFLKMRRSREGGVNGRNLFEVRLMCDSPRTEGNTSTLRIERKCQHHAHAAF